MIATCVGMVLGAIFVLWYSISGTEIPDISIMAIAMVFIFIFMGIGLMKK